MKPPALPSRSRERGFTLFEFAVAASIIGILAMALLNRIIFYREQAEHVAMLQMVGALRTALNFKVASLMVRNRSNELASLVDENPMDWLAEKPNNYLGEYFSPMTAELAEGNWYFDRTEKKLVYLPSNGGVFNQDVHNRVNFKVRPASYRSDVTNSIRKSDMIEGVVLDQEGK